MNAVEIEEAVSLLAEQPFEAEAFPYAFLEAFGNKATTIKRLKSGSTNKSDIGGVLQRGNIHIKTCPEGKVAETLDALRESAVTTSQKAKFILATDGKEFHAEDLEGGDTLVCGFPDFADHFGFFLELAGISTVRAIKENSFDIKATSRLNKLYVELLKDNPDWGTSARRPEMNHFMARLIFCFFAKDTDIFYGDDLFTATVEQMSERDSSNTHEIISELFRAMNTKVEDRAAGNFRPWANVFPLVNGGLFSGNLEVPKFTKIARSYLLHVGKLNWTKVNPDIFGSMIQAVADDEERGALGMHYTSVPNILKVLNPLFLDDLRAKLEEAADNGRKLLNLRNRIARIRVFDPACGSGNFLVIAYKEMRAIEAIINQRRGETDRRTDIPLTNFRGIELRDFSAEIARLALIIAEYQCDVMYRGQKEALAEFLPLEKANWITCGNALRLDWLSVCPPTGTSVKNRADDLFETPLDQAEIDFRNEGGETYICGNPPYLGNKLQSADQKNDMASVFNGKILGWKSLDYIAAWIMKASLYGDHTPAKSAFVSTNSICQGQQVPILWPSLISRGYHIQFAYNSFKWSNLASKNAGVIVIVVCISNTLDRSRSLFTVNASGEVIEKACENINPYLADGPNVVVEAKKYALNDRSPMLFGNMPRDGGNLLIDADEYSSLVSKNNGIDKYIRPFAGSHDFIHGKLRYCFWISESDFSETKKIPILAERIELVKSMRLESKAESTRSFARYPYRFVQIQGASKKSSLIIPRHSSVRRNYLPIGLLDSRTIVADSAFAIYDAPLWHFTILSSKLHLTWIAAVCGKLKTDYRYSNTIGWNTFPIPQLTERNKMDLNTAASEILLARESYFPAALDKIYDPDYMESRFPEVLRAHEKADEILERIFIGRNFRNDTERLSGLFNLYNRLSKESK